MTLRARMRERIRAAAGFSDAAEVFRVHQEPADRTDAVMTFSVGAGTVSERIAEADKIAAALGATTKWENGYYTAEMCQFKIHFAPLIAGPPDAGSDD